MYRFGGFCDGIEVFDADIFRFPLAEAAATDPAQRILMEQTQNSLSDAELCMSSKLGPSTGPPPTNAEVHFPSAQTIEQWLLHLANQKQT